MKKKIAFVLCRTMGDIVLGNLILKNVKLQYPDSEIDWFVDVEYNALVEGNPNVSTIINLKDWIDVLRRISFGYDIVVVPQQTNAIDNSWHQQGEYRYGHLLDFYAQRCDLEIKDRKLELYVKGGLAGDWCYLKKPIIAIHTKTLADVKNWSKFPELVKRLKELGYSVMQLGTKQDPEIEGALKVVLSLSEIIQFFNERSCNAFVGLDSGITYISAAFNIPTIQIMGATIPITSGAWGDNVITILSQNNKECEKERKGIRCHGILGGVCKFGITKCIDSITADTVIEILNNILKKEK